MTRKWRWKFFFLSYKQVGIDVDFPQSFSNAFLRKASHTDIIREKLLNVMSVTASRGGISYKLKYPREVLESLAAGREGRTGRGAVQWKSWLGALVWVGGECPGWRAQAVLLDKELGSCLGVNVHGMSVFGILLAKNVFFELTWLLGGLVVACWNMRVSLESPCKQIWGDDGTYKNTLISFEMGKEEKPTGEAEVWWNTIFINDIIMNVFSLCQHTSKLLNIGSKLL